MHRQQILRQRDADMTMDRLDIHDMPGHLIRRLQQISVSVFTEHVSSAGYDLTPVQFAALSAVNANPGLDQASLAGLIAYDRVTIGGVVDRLVQKDLVDRIVSTRDRRARELRVTPQGLQTLAAIDPVVQQAQQAMTKGLSADERRQLLALLKKTTEAGNDLSRAPWKPMAVEA